MADRVNKTESQSIFTKATPNLYATDAMADVSGLAKGLEMSANLLVERDKIVDEAKVLEAYAEATRRKQDLLYDPTDGIYTKTGALAEGEDKRFKVRTDEIGREATLKLSAEQQKKFGEMWTRSNISDIEGVKRHGMGEAVKYRTAASQAVVEQATAAASFSYNDPSSIAKAKTEIAGATLTELKGQDPTVVAQAVAERWSSLHKAVILKKIDENPFEAKKYYDANKEEIVGNDHTQVMTAIRPAIMAARVQSETQKIVNGSGPIKKLGTAIKNIQTRVAPGNTREERALNAAVPTVESGNRSRVVTRNFYPGTTNFDPERTAVGQWQVTVRTARDISKELGDGILEGKSAEEVKELLQDDEMNERYGLHYLHKFVKKYDGDIEAALVQYNSGQADAWLRSGRDYSVLKGQGTVGDKKVAFRQTENYVQKVMREFARNLNSEAGYDKTKATIADISEEEPLDAATQFRTLNDSYVGKKFDDFHAALSPELREGLSTMLTDAPSEVAKELKIDGKKGDEGGISVQFKSPSGFAQTWVRANAAKYGLNVPMEEPTKVEAAPKSNETTVYKIEPITGEATASPTAPERIPTLHDEHNLQEWLDKAEQIQDPVLKDKVLSELNQRFSLYEKANNQKEQQFKVTAWKMALEGQTIPPQIMAGLSPEYANSINTYLRAKSRGVDIETNWEAWWGVMQKTPEELARVDPFTLRDKLNDKEFNKLLDLVKDAKGIPTPGKEGVSADARSSRQRIEDTVKSMGLSAEGKAKLAARYDMKSVEFVREKNRKPDAIEAQAILDSLVLERDSAWYQKNARVFEIQPGQKMGSTNFVTKQEDIPLGDRLKLFDRYRQTFKKEISSSEVLQLYSAYVVGEQGGLMDVPKALRPHLEKYAKARNLPTNDDAMSVYYMDWVKRMMK